MTYTFKSARYANADRTAVVADTVEVAHVALSETDTPDLWAALQKSGVEIAPYVEREFDARTADERIVDGLIASGVVPEDKRFIVLSGMSGKNTTLQGTRLS